MLEFGAVVKFHSGKTYRNTSLNACLD